MLDENADGDGTFFFFHKVKVYNYFNTDFVYEILT